MSSTATSTTSASADSPASLSKKTASNNTKGSKQSTAEPIKADVKLAPAPVPQETPWKALSSGTQAKPKVESVDAQTSKKINETQNQRQRESKRSTTGKEKWVPFTPEVPENLPRPMSNNNGQRNMRQNKKQQNNRQKRGNNNNNSSNHSNRNNRSGTDNHKPNHSRSQSRQTVDEDKMSKLNVSDDNNESKPNRYNNRNYQYRNNNNNNESGVRKQRESHNVPGQVPFYPNTLPSQPMNPHLVPVPMSISMQQQQQAEYYFNALVGQVNYYFSVENLCKDMFLRKHMDDEGFVPISFIADFNRVKTIAPNVELVAQALLHAPNVEIVGPNVRVVDSWQRWILPAKDRTPLTEKSNTELTPQTSSGIAS